MSKKKKAIDEWPMEKCMPLKIDYDLFELSQSIRMTDSEIHRSKYTYFNLSLH